LIRRLTAATVLHAVLLAGCASPVASPPQHVALGIVRGGSMLPAVTPGAVVMHYGYPFKRLHAGDVVAYRSDRLGFNVIHRLVSKRAGGWVAKGDANQSYDGDWVTPSNYIAKALLTPADWQDSQSVLAEPSLAGRAITKGNTR
jgi:signal peptidase I